MEAGARGLILDDEGRYVLIRRTRPAQEPYLVAPGGGLAPGESAAQAVQREVAEELGAAVAVGETVLVVQHDEPGSGSVQRFLLCRLLEIDDAARYGHEFREPGRGGYETVPIDPSDPELATLRPPELLALIRARGESFVADAALIDTDPHSAA